MYTYTGEFIFVSEDGNFDNINAPQQAIDNTTVLVYTLGGISHIIDPRDTDDFVATHGLDDKADPRDTSGPWMMLKDQSVKICVLQKGESTISLRAAATLGISHISIVQEHLWTEQLSYLLTKKHMAEEEDKKKVMEEEEVEHPDFGIGWTPGWCWSGCLWIWDGIEGKSSPPPRGPPPPEYYTEEEQ